MQHVERVTEKQGMEICFLLHLINHRVHRSMQILAQKGDIVGVHKTIVSGNISCVITNSRHSTISGKKFHIDIASVIHEGPNKCLAQPHGDSATLRAKQMASFDSKKRKKRRKFLPHDQR